jgi:hypothetical protein
MIAEEYIPGIIVGLGPDGTGTFQCALSVLFLLMMNSKERIRCSR